MAPVRPSWRCGISTFPSPVLFPWRNVLGNVLLPADVQRLGREPMTKRALELIALVGLSGFENRYPWELSGGMQQRVALACRSLPPTGPASLLSIAARRRFILAVNALRATLARVW